MYIRSYISKNNFDTFIEPLNITYFDNKVQQIFSSIYQNSQYSQYLQHFLSILNLYTKNSELIKQKLYYAQITYEEFKQNKYKNIRLIVFILEDIFNIKIILLKNDKGKITLNTISMKNSKTNWDNGIIILLEDGFEYKIITESSENRPHSVGFYETKAKLPKIIQDLLKNNDISGF